MGDPRLREIETETMVDELIARHDSVLIAFMESKTKGTVQARVIVGGDLAWGTLLQRAVVHATDAAFFSSVPVRREYRPGREP